MTLPVAAVSAAERFQRLLERSCPRCGAGWSSHSLAVTEGIGTGLLLCESGDLFCVHYPEGDVFRVTPRRSVPVDLGPATVLSRGLKKSGPHAKSTTSKPDSESADVPQRAAVTAGGALTSRQGVDPTSSSPGLAACPVCAGDLRTAGHRRGRVCPACAESGIAALEVGGSLRLLCDGWPVPGLAAVVPTGPAMEGGVDA